MRGQIVRWGDSLALRIPGALARDVDLQEGQPVSLRAKAGRLVIGPVDDPEYDLAELVGAITDENRHDEFDFGTAGGGPADLQTKEEP